MYQPPFFIHGTSLPPSRPVLIRKQDLHELDDIICSDLDIISSDLDGVGSRDLDIISRDVDSIIFRNPALVPVPANGPVSLAVARHAGPESETRAVPRSDGGSERQGDDGDEVGELYR